VPSIYEVPLRFADENLDGLILKYLHIDAPKRTCAWKDLVDAATPKDKSPSPSWVNMWSTRTATNLSRSADAWGCSQNLQLKVTWIEPRAGIKDT